MNFEFWFKTEYNLKQQMTRLTAFSAKLRIKCQTLAQTSTQMSFEKMLSKL